MTFPVRDGSFRDGEWKTETDCGCRQSSAQQDQRTRTRSGKFCGGS